VPEVRRDFRWAMRFSLAETQESSSARIIEEELIVGFSGIWNVVSSPEFDEGYLRTEVDPYLTLHQSGDRVEGRYQVGLQTGDLYGRLEGQNRIFFSFEGMDELEEMNGAGMATLNRNRLTFELRYHQGDEYTFECERME
jgi:hypothetical protein